MSEQTFEKTFSDLVENRLKEETPYLVDYSVGFEIKDKDKDGTKGMGVYAFLINSIPAYIPVVYNKGNIDGFELLWLAKQKIMVPSTSRWVDTLKDKSENVFGDLVTGTDIQTRSARSPEGTVFQSSTFPYAIKTAEQDGSMADGEVIRGMLSGTASDSIVKGILTDYLRDNPAATAVFCKTALEYPEFADAVQQVYRDSGAVYNIVRENSRNMEKQAEEEKSVPVQKGKVKVITDLSDPDVYLLNKNQKKILMKKGSYVLDSRDEHSTVFNNKQAEEILSNVSDSGFYEVLDAKGGMKQAWVGKFTGNNTDTKNNTDVVVVFRKSPNTGHVFKHKDIFASAENGEEFEVGKKIESLKDFNKLEGRSVAIISNKGGLTELTADNPSGENKYAKVCKSNNFSRDYTSEKDTRKVVFTDNPETDVNVSPGFVTIGPLARAIGLKRYDDKREFNPGSPEDFNESIRKKAGLSKLDIQREGSSVCMRMDGRYQNSSNIEREFRRLIFDIGIHPGDARSMLKTALDHGSVSYLVKLAGPLTIGPLHTADPEVTNVRYTKPEITEVRDARETGVMLEQARATAQRAAEVGNDDLFEITTLKSLMQIVEDKSMKRNSFVKLLRGMDECGRNLFRLYFKRDEMTKEHGSEDVEKLEDSLKNNFKALGELVIFLQDKFTSLHSPFQNSMQGLIGNSESSENIMGIESDTE